MIIRLQEKNKQNRGKEQRDKKKKKIVKKLK